MIQINGEPKNCSGTRLTDCISDMGYDPKRIAVERNGEIVPKAQYHETILRDGDVLEVVNFVGGG